MNGIRLIAFARGRDGKMYMVQNTNTGTGYVIAGNLAGQSIDSIRNESDGAFGALGTIAGIAGQSYVMNRAMQQMQSPKTIERLIRNVGVDRSVKVLNILKVNSYVVTDKYIKIKYIRS